MKISFFGAAGTVTGSKFLITDDKDQVLIDCGLFQGLKQLRVLNWDQPNFDPTQLKGIILTHAHLDHCGYLPLIFKQGYRGPIFCTSPTKELAKIILLDSGKIQEEDADYANRKGFSKHKPAMPLYSVNDVTQIFPYFKEVNLKEVVKIGNFEFQFLSGGHILGATSILLKTPLKKIFISGDLGRFNDPLMPRPQPPLPCDLMIMESTYGDRKHGDENAEHVLTSLINQINKSKGVLLIPAFAIGRAQNLIFDIVRLKKMGLIPKTIPIYFNTPMGQDVWQLYRKYSSFQKLSREEFDDFTNHINFVETAEQSKKLNEQQGPMIIIAASGMLTGGRILHHLKAFAGDAKNIILLAGFQSIGTRGWSLANGQKKIKLHGIYVEVQAQVINSECFSAHADQEELLNWISSASKIPQYVFLVHGEPSASDELRKILEEKLHIKIFIPNLNDTYLLNDSIVRKNSFKDQ